MKEEYAPYVDLAHAVIFKAAEDYKALLQKYKDVQDMGGVVKKVSTSGANQYKKRANVYYITLESVKNEMRPLERFFKSAWGELLSGLNGEALIRELKRKEGVA